MRPSIKLRNIDEYYTNMHKIYNLIVGQTNKQLQEKAAPNATYQEVKTDWDPIGYLNTIKKLCLSNQSEHHLIWSPFLDTKQLYNTTHYPDKNTTNFLVRFLNVKKVNEKFNGSHISKVVQ